MARTLADIAAWLGGTLVGDGTVLITGAAPLGSAKPGDLTLIDESEKAHRRSTGNAAAAIAPRNYAPRDLPTVQVDNPHAAFAQVVALFRPPLAPPSPGISPQAHIAPSARIAPDVTILSGVTIGDDVTIGRGSVIHAGCHIFPGCSLGENVTLFPNVVLYEHTAIGARVIVHAGAVLGAYGFGYKLHGGKYQLSAQLGYVEIADDVEIGACSTIDRGTYGPTIVGEGTKIDNQVMIAHNCRIGRHNIICSQVGIAGSTTTGDYVIMAGQVGVRDHVHIGDRAVLCGKSGVTNDVRAGEQMLGNPATPLRDEKLKQAVLNRLPEMRKQFKEFERTLARFERQFGCGPGAAA
ncbi:MAG TPA: UDP-3-O-(3-hydroxymyristoyl)glucosamine N-acyltransferase [Pirellulales bacterium]|jgi:UDP-3-O-[3-hydroxymyristoyl] glucosamine N-acyltransferase|nr:UDP-3-O-(3-hydroxymyristoyl)glucosamine N-acyltransferase [Pirellulales bacterium]